MINSNNIYSTLHQMRIRQEGYLKIIHNLHSQNQYLKKIINDNKSINDDKRLPNRQDNKINNLSNTNHIPSPNQNINQTLSPQSNNYIKHNKFIQLGKSKSENKTIYQPHVHPSNYIITPFQKVNQQVQFNNNPQIQPTHQRNNYLINNQSPSQQSIFLKPTTHLNNQSQTNFIQGFTLRKIKENESNNINNINNILTQQQNYQLIEQFEQTDSITKRPIHSIQTNNTIQFNKDIQRHHKAEIENKIDKMQSQNIKSLYQHKQKISAEYYLKQSKCYQNQNQIKHEQTPNQSPVNYQNNLNSPINLVKLEGNKQKQIPNNDKELTIIKDIPKELNQNKLWEEKKKKTYITNHIYL